MARRDPFKGMGVRVTLDDPTDFLKVKETLTRIGTGVRDGTLEQTCYLLHKRGEYAIMHWLEMRVLDGEDVVVDIPDVAHRNTVAHLLDNWGLVRVENPDEVDFPRVGPEGVKIIPYKQKADYKLVPLYQIGRVMA